MTFRRTRHSPIDECHCFVAKTKYTALHLVEACYKAYHATDSQQDCSKVPLYFKVKDNNNKKRNLRFLFRLIIIDQNLKKLIMKYILYQHQIENKH